jgi:nucleoside-diphosphate-sugar epimerase
MFMVKWVLATGGAGFLGPHLRERLIEECALTLVRSPPDFPGPVNMGNPQEFTIRELADIVVEMTGSNSRLVACPLPADDPCQGRPDIALAERALGWRPKIGLRERLTHTIAYFDRQLAGERASPRRPDGRGLRERVDAAMTTPARRAAGRAGHTHVRKEFGRNVQHWLTRSS